MFLKYEIIYNVVTRATMYHSISNGDMEPYYLLPVISLKNCQMFIRDLKPLTT